ncbi:MAG: putative esterase [Nevskia sp.]|nr:putative esterase [Nevskia sp.]
MRGLSSTQRDMSFFLPGNDIGILLIHGLTGTPVEMRYVGKGLARAGYTVYGAQLAGHCGTEQDLAATGWQDWADSALAALDHLRQHVSRVFVGGLSMGAIMALHLAAQRRDGVDGLLLYGPTLKYDGWTIPWYSFLLKFLIYTPFGKRYVFMEKPPYGIKDERLRKRVVQNMLSGNSADAGLAGLPSFCLQQMWALSQQVESELAQIQVPTLILHAREDDVASLKNPLKILQAVAGPAELVLMNDSYHMITVDRERDQVVARSIEHISRFAQPQHSNLQRGIPQPAQTRMQAQA